MNKKQRNILIVGLIIAAGMILYPPWMEISPNDDFLNLGYAFLFSPPESENLPSDYLKFVVWNRLGAQLAGLAVLTGATYLFAKD